MGSSAVVRFLRDVVALAGATAIGYAVVALASPVLSRLYTPTDLGRLGLFLALVVCSTILASFRYESAIIGAENDNDASDLALVSALIGIATSLGVGLALYTLITIDILGFGTLSFYAIPFAILSVSCGAASNAFRALLIRKAAFKVAAKASVLRNVSAVMAQIGLGAAGTFWVGLLAGEVIGRIVALVYLVKGSDGATLGRCDLVRLKRLISVVRRYKSFPLYGMPSSVLDSVSSGLSVPLLTQLYGSAAVGQFVLAQSVMLLPVALVGGSVADVFHSRLVVLQKEDPRSVRRFFWRMTLILFSIGIVPAAVVSLWGDWIFLKAFGPMWGVAGNMAALMVPWMIAALTVSPVSRLVFVLGGQRLKLVYDAFTLFAVLGVFFVSRRGVPFLDAVAMLSAVHVASYLLYYSLLSITVARQSQPGGSKIGETADTIV